MGCILTQFFEAGTVEASFHFCPEWVQLLTSRAKITGNYRFLWILARLESAAYPENMKESANHRSTFSIVMCLLASQPA